MTDYRIKQGGLVVAGSTSKAEILRYAYQYSEDGAAHVQVKDGKRWKDLYTIRKGRLMTDYRIEAATKEEWAERALRAERKLADTAIDYKKQCEVLEERWEAACQDAREAEAYAGELEAKLAKAVDALEHEVKRSRRHLSSKTLATLAELKGDTP